MKKYCIFLLILLRLSDCFSQVVPDSSRIDSEVDISGVEIIAKRNPAYYIMEKVLAFKDNNDYEKYKAYSYKAYDKLFITSIVDSSSVIEKNSEEDKIVNDMYLFFMESISEGKFMYPDNKYEEVKATKMSGIREPVIDIFLAQLQINSFYDNYIDILSSRILSPLNKESILSWKPKYYFNIEDTIIKNFHDTVFVISFRPVLSSTFTGLSGTLNVNSNKWAIEEINAEIYKREQDKKSMYNVYYSQKFELLNDSLWFPTFYKMNVSTSAIAAEINGNVRVYPFICTERIVYDVDFDAKIKKMSFGNVAYSMDPNAFYRNENYWNLHRKDSLDSKAAMTYMMLDSLDKKHNLTNKLNALTSILFGRIAIWKFDLLINNFMNYNKYEGYSLGLGVETNRRLSEWFSVGGYYRYGFHDKTSKWGANTKLKLNKTGNAFLHISYADDIQEAGGKQVNNNISIFNPDYFRNFLLDRMDHIQYINLQSSFSAFKYCSFTLGISKKIKFPLYDYSFHEHAFENYNFTVAHAEIRFAYKEKFYTSKYGLISLGTKYPIITVNYEHGFAEFLKGTYNFNKIRLNVKGHLPIKDIFNFNFYVEGAFLDSDIPYTELFNAPAAYYKFTLFTPNAFECMHLNEFVSDVFFYSFISLDLLKTFNTNIRWFRPKPSLCFNYGVGNLINNTDNSHHGVEINTMSKGYYECGININGILDLKIYNLGFGVFHRFGHYSLPYFAYKLTLSIPFDRLNF